MQMKLGITAVKVKFCQSLLFEFAVFFDLIKSSHQIHDLSLTQVEVIRLECTTLPLTLRSVWVLATKVNDLIMMFHSLYP